MQEQADVIIGKLLRERLTKFQYGFVLGLKGHNPTKEQSEILRSIAIRYPAISGSVEMNERNDYTDNHFASAR